MNSSVRVNAVALMLVCALGTSHASEVRRDPPAREGVALAVSQCALEPGTGETSFNFARLRDLWIRVTLRNATDVVQLNLRLIDPQGTLIYEASVPYATDPTMTAMELPGAGRPVTVFPAKKLSGGVALD